MYNGLTLLLSHTAPMLLTIEKFVTPSLVACLIMFRVPFTAA